MATAQIGKTSSPASDKFYNHVYDWVIGYGLRFIVVLVVLLPGLWLLNRLLARTLYRHYFARPGRLSLDDNVWIKAYGFTDPKMQLQKNLIGDIKTPVSEFPVCNIWPRH
jgi:hypothetical protein